MASQPVAERNHPIGYSAHAKADVIQHVASELEKGERGVARILREDEGMPQQRHFYAWLDENLHWREEIERAREIAATTLLEGTLDIAENVVAEKDAIAKAKLRIYQREMFAAKIAPKRFGNKVDVTSGGKELKSAQLNDNRLQSLVQIAATRKAEDMKRLEKDEG